jgi:hypothetical protein
MKGSGRGRGEVLYRHLCGEIKARRENLRIAGFRGPGGKI